MTGYFRITGYYPDKNICFIADSNGRFEKKWQFSSYLVNKGIKIIEIGDDTQFLDGDLPKVEEDKDHIIIRACGQGKPQLDGNCIIVQGKRYIPDKNR